MHFGGAAYGLPNEQGQHSADRSRNRGDVEREAPTEAQLEQAATQEAQSNAKRQSNHENRKRLGPPRCWKKVADQRGCRRSARRFATSYAEAHGEELREVP